MPFGKKTKKEGVKMKLDDGLSKKGGLKEAADFWNNILGELAGKIQNGHAKISPYERGEGPERDSITYGYKIFSKDYCFYIECFYPVCHPKALRRFSVKKNRGFFTSFSKSIVRFDIDELICLNQDLSSVAQLKATCVKIHEFLDRVLENKKVDKLFGCSFLKSQ